MPVRIVVADGHPLVARGLRDAIESDEGMEVVAEVRSGAAALSAVARTRADVVLMDAHLPDVDGFACLERLRERHPGVKVIVLSSSGDSEQVAAAFRRGAAGYILSTADLPDVVAAVRQAQRQTVFQPPVEAVHQLGALRAPAANGEELTAREREILDAVAHGLSNHAIARRLWVTEQTVKFHLTNVYRKLGVPNRTAAARYAHQHGLVDTSIA